MSSDGLGSCDVKQELENKENQAPEREFPREEDVDFNPSSSSFSAWQKSISERPPYSYMAMIQFAINSTERKRMTLKEIYTWIEDHFPYFKHVAKPGWKNSIRHNLSLHDMFVRETSANGKISFWTIHPDANRCLTLDQVFKPMDQDTPLHLLPCEPQQKRLLPELQKSVAGGSGIKSDIPGGIGAAERKMKLLLPRVNSYFVPFQFPVNQAFVQQPPGKASLNSVSSVSTTDLTKASKRVQIAPKTQTSKEDTIALVEAPSTAIKEENEKSSFSCSKGKVSFTAFTSPAWQIPGIQIPSKEDNIALKNKPPTAAIKEEFEVEVEVEEEEQEVEVAALAKLSCPRENILYTALKPPAWKMPDKQASMVKDGSSHIPPAKELTSLAVKDSRFSVLRADVPLSSWKEDRTLYTSKSPARKIPDMQVIRRRKGGSRRKQHLAIPCAEEPLLFPECSNSDSGLVSDFSFLQETHALEPSTDFSCTQENFSFKTPIKEKFKLPASSTPSKPNGAAPPAGSSDPWRVTSLNKDADLPDFSPVRLPQGTTLTPLKDTLDLLAFSSPPFNDLPLFDSPQQLLNNKSPEVTSGPFTNSPTFEPLSAKRCAKELQIGSSTNRSLTEGLVLDTMNDSLSKILLDISFSGLEDDDDFERDNVSWSQFIPELR